MNSSSTISSPFAGFRIEEKAGGEQPPKQQPAEELSKDSLVEVDPIQPHDFRTIRKQHPRRKLIYALNDVIRDVTTTDEAWEIYQELRNIYAKSPIGTPLRAIIILATFHRVMRIFAAQNPRTHENYLRLLEVLTEFRKVGGQPNTWEWNALIDYAGKGWRKTRLEDYQSAVNIYHDLFNETNPAAAKPDIVTYTTLLNIASNTHSPKALDHALSLLRSSALVSNRITSLVSVKYYYKMDKLRGVRQVLGRMISLGFDIGIDGVNAFLWAYGQEARFDIVFKVYRFLRNESYYYDDDEPPDEVEPMGHEGQNIPGLPIEGILVPEELQPDEITYITIIQCLAYHGHFAEAIGIWSDMLAATKPEPSPTKDSGAVSNSHNPISSDIPDVEDPLAQEPLKDYIAEDDEPLSFETQPEIENFDEPLVERVGVNYSPALSAFRAIFLGFARHAPHPRATTWLSNDKSAWSYENLRGIVSGFVDLPDDVQPSELTMYWVLIALSKTTGHDLRRMRELWAVIEKRYTVREGGRLKTLIEQLRPRPKHTDSS